MAYIKDILTKYYFQIDPLDLDLIIAHILKKTREFVLAHPEHPISRDYELQIANHIRRRRRGEPLAYIFGEKEFYGLTFMVNKNVLIPRPETEVIVDLVIHNLKSLIGSRDKIIIADIGTGSGNIIISVATEIKSKLPITNYELLATDISKKTLAVAKRNAKLNKVDKKIKFFQGDLLKPILRITKYTPRLTRIIILANLPYLSPSIYKSASVSVRHYEPKNALSSHYRGLRHYHDLLKQILRLAQMTDSQLPITVLFEFSPEQKIWLEKLIAKYFPEAFVKFYKDLAGKWRACCINIKNGI